MALGLRSHADGWGLALCVALRNWCCGTCILDLLALLEAISRQLPLDGAIYSVRSHLQQMVSAKLVIVKRERRVTFVCRSTFWSIFDPLWVVFSFFIAMALCGFTKIRTNYFSTSGSIKRFPRTETPVICSFTKKAQTPVLRLFGVSVFSLLIVTLFLTILANLYFLVLLVPSSTYFGAFLVTSSYLCLHNGLTLVYFGGACIFFYSSVVVAKIN
eukprot:SAG11_NODE_1168_length_5617_cov_20.200254_1_plen_215_part_00